MVDTPNSPDSPLVNPAPSPEEGEVLLRSRDVQALSRTFRRLAEIQDGLADHIRELEEERQKKWMLPAVALASLVLGAGMSLFGMGWLKQQEEQPTVSVDLASLPANSIQVQAPDGAVDAELLAQFMGQLDEMKQSQSQDRRMIAEMGTKLIEGEMSALSMLKQMQAFEAGVPLDAIAMSHGQDQPASANGGDGGAIGGEHIPAQPVAANSEAAAQAVENADKVGPDELGYPADAWLGALNGLMAVDGYPHFRFQQATEVKDKPRLTDVIFFVWSEDGLLQTIVRADSVDFYLQESTFSLRLHFLNGTRTRDGVKTALPNAGLTVSLPDVNVPAWVAHFPALGPEGIPWQAIGKVPPPSPVLVDPNPAGSEEQGGDVANGNSESNDAGANDNSGDQISPLERTRQGLDALLSQRHSFGHYRLEKVGRMEQDALKVVRLSWYDSNGNLFKYIEADTLRIRSRGQGWIELILENGSFIRLGKKTPFRDPEYRIHLPSQKVADWRSTGITVSEPE